MGIQPEVFQRFPEVHHIAGACVQAFPQTTHRSSRWRSRCTDEHTHGPGGPGLSLSARGARRPHGSTGFAVPWRQPAKAGLLLPPPRFRELCLWPPLETTGLGFWLDHGGVVEAIGFAPTAMPGPGLARYSFPDLGALYGVLPRIYALSASLFDAPLQQLVVQRVGQDIFAPAHGVLAGPLPPHTQPPNPSGHHEKSDELPTWGAFHHEQASFGEVFYGTADFATWEGGFFVVPIIRRLFLPTHGRTARSRSPYKSCSLSACRHP